MAGELGLEPRMTVPKTGVLPLHHSPAGPASPRPAARRRSDTPSRSGTQEAFRGELHRGSGRNSRDRRSAISDPKTICRKAFSALAGAKTRRYKPPPQVGVWLSLVEHCVRDAGVGGSNPLTPTILSKGFPRPSEASERASLGRLFSFQPPAFDATAARCAPTLSIVRSPRALRRASSSGDPAS